MSNFYAYLNRTLCDVLAEMRKCCETANYSYLPGLVEEAQSMANRMEAALEDRKDISNWSEEWHEKKDEMKKLSKEIKKLEKKKAEFKNEKVKKPRSKPYER